MLAVALALELELVVAVAGMLLGAVDYVQVEADN